MSDISNAPAGGADAIVSVPVSTPAQSDNSPITATEAAKQLSDWRNKRDNPDEKSAAAPKEVETAPSESAQADDAPLDEAPVETAEATEPEVDLPLIDPPRSWTKEEQAEFATYPREAQEKIARREQDRERTLRQSQNEAAEQRKAMDAERSKVDQARQQYEAALPALLQTLQEQQAGEFSDIRTMADVEKLAREDWPRYALWDAQQKKVAAVTQEVNAARQRQEQDFKSKWSDFTSKEDQAFMDKVPEFSDKAVAQKWSDGAVSVLKDVGFSEKELASAFNGEASLSLRDHRVQLLIYDATRFRQAKTGASKPVVKPLPPVQRPGVAKAAVSATQADVDSAQKRFDRTGSLKDAQALRVAQQKARA